MKTSKLQQGFVSAQYTELMLLITIIGILASIVIPVYKDYVIRNHVKTGLILAESAKAAVEKNVSNGSPFNMGWIAPNATEYVSSKSEPTETDRTSNVDSGIAINPINGIITITYTNKVARNSPTLLLLPVVDKALPIAGVPSKNIKWECHSSIVPTDSLLPDILGTISAKYVPAHCRLQGMLVFI